MIRIKTNERESLVVTRSGDRMLSAIELWRGVNGKLFIDGIGRSGRTLRAGFVIDKDSAAELLTAIYESIQESLI